MVGRELKKVHKEWECGRNQEHETAGTPFASNDHKQGNTMRPAIDKALKEPLTQAPTHRW